MRSVFVIGAVLAALAAAEPVPPDQTTPEERQKALAEVRRDQTADQVRRTAGKPDRVSRQILFRKHLEQWVYDLPNPVRIEFLCLPGEEARVLTVYSPASNPPR